MSDKALMGDILKRKAEDELVADLNGNTYPEILLTAREAADTIEALRRELAEAKRATKVMYDSLETSRKQLAASQQALRNVYEVWAGSEGIPVLETVVEAYLLRLVEKMRDAAKEGLK
jgi:hypothetical protein